MPSIRYDTISVSSLTPSIAGHAVSEACELTARLVALRDEQTAAAVMRRRALLVASRAGVSYDALADATGLNRSFLAAEIKQARVEWSGDPSIAAGRRGTGDA